MGEGGENMNINPKELQFDAYIKKTIKNTVINYKKQENTKKHRETSFEDINEEIAVPFLFEMRDKLEDYVENEKLYNAIASLNDEQKQIMKLKILDNYTSKEISRLMKKSDSRIRHIYSDAINQIREKLKGE